LPELDELRRRLRGAPDDPDVWAALGRHAARAGLPGDTVSRGQLRHFVEAWLRRPGEPGMRAVFRWLTDLEAIHPGGDPEAPARSRGRHWQRRRVRVGPEGLPLDKATAMPLAVRHLPTSMELRWVPRPAEAHRELVGAYIGRFPVTVAEFACFLEAHPGVAPTDYLARNPWDLQAAQPNRPVVFLSLKRAREFAAWMGAEVPDARLWRHAAARGRRFPWGKGPPGAQVNWNHGVPWRGGDWDRFLAPVDSHPEGVGPFGLEGMVGNVWEWTEEGARAREDEVVAGREDRAVFRHRLLGGSWGSTRLQELEVDGEGRWLDSGWWSDDVGFRVAVPLWRPEGSVPERAARGEPGPRRRRKVRAKVRRRKQRRRAR
jgi:formylglycine-generating enzyme required for sulfatase activity